MKWTLLRWLLLALILVGLLMASGDGPLFPWTNLVGMALAGAAVAALGRDPEYRRLARRSP